MEYLNDVSVRWIEKYFKWFLDYSYSYFEYGCVWNGIQVSTPYIKRFSFHKHGDLKSLWSLTRKQVFIF